MFEGTKILSEGLKTLSKGNRFNSRMRNEKPLVKCFATIGGYFIPIVGVAVIGLSTIQLIGNFKTNYSK